MLFAITKIPMPIIGVILNTGPLFIIILNKIFYGNKLNKNDPIFIILSFVGVSIISG